MKCKCKSTPHHLAHVMLSYAWGVGSKYKTFMMDFRGKLERALKKESGVYDICVWLDQLDIPLGSHLQEVFVKAVRRSAVVICFLSAEYSQRPNCMLEFEAAQLPGGENKIIPMIPCMLQTPDEIQADLNEIQKPFDGLQLLAHIPPTLLWQDMKDIMKVYFDKDPSPSKHAAMSAKADEAFASIVNSVLTHHAEYQSILQNALPKSRAE